jgi:hypothetical protein
MILVERPSRLRLYKSRRQIELLFRWIKQHLDIRKFLGNNDNAIRLQVLAAMIAYLLLRIAARSNCPACIGAGPTSSAAPMYVAATDTIGAIVGKPCAD